MPLIFPTQNTLCTLFGPSPSFSRPAKDTRREDRPLRESIFPAHSTVDTLKEKTGDLGSEAAREWEKASSIAQKKAGAIELYSPKYYTACIIGGALACVSLLLSFIQLAALTPV